MIYGIGVPSPESRAVIEEALRPYWDLSAHEDHTQEHPQEGFITGTLSLAIAKLKSRKKSELVTNNEVEELLIMLDEAVSIAPVGAVRAELRALARDLHDCHYSQPVLRFHRVSGRKAQ